MQHQNIILPYLYKILKNLTSTIWTDETTKIYETDRECQTAKRQRRSNTEPIEVN